MEGARKVCKGSTEVHECAWKGAQGCAKVHRCAQKVHKGSAKVRKCAQKGAQRCAKVCKGAQMCAKRCTKVRKGVRGCVNVREKVRNSAQKVCKVHTGTQKAWKGVQVCAEVHRRVHRWGRSPGRVGGWCGCGGCRPSAEKVKEVEKFRKILKSVPV